MSADAQYAVFFTLLGGVLAVAILGALGAFVGRKDRESELIDALQDAADNFESIVSECEFGAVDPAVCRSVVKHVAERGHHAALQAIEDVTCEP